jgi:GNAT superfamily N-acetyltransferase
MEAHYVRRVIELVAGTTDTFAAARIRKTVWRWMEIEPETIELYRATWPRFRDWLALLDGEPVGAAACALMPGMEEDAAAFAVNCVLPEARRQGVGTAIYRQVSVHARSLGKSELAVFGFEDDLDGVAFAERRGFVVVSRFRGLRLLLDGCPRPTIDLPEEIAITTLAERPELAQGVWETACEAMPDIPHDGDVPMSAGSFEEFRARHLAGPRYIPEATFVAVRDGEVLGYAQLGWMNRAAGLADHAMLAVRVARARDRPGAQGVPDYVGTRQPTQRATHRKRRTQRVSTSRQCQLCVHAAPRPGRLSRAARRAGM